MPDQQQKQRPSEPAPWSPQESGPGDGPRTPNISKPDTSEIIKKLKRVDPEQSRKFKQRSGQ